MHDLHHMVLPPSFLSENPKEAGFCLWLLHPEPMLRPSTTALSADGENAIASVSETEIRLMSSISQLENAYFSLSSNIQLSDNKVATQRDGELLKSRENWCTVGNEGKNNTVDSLGGFFDGLCKYARYNKFKVQGVLRNGEFNSSANVICSLSFDRDEDYLAAGGVSKKIKIFEFQSLFNDSIDIHYPVVEMSNKSKLSCICWISYIRNYLVSADYDGIVKMFVGS
ncbi:hypothetical protein OROGR_012956 [Orobanche gracilis]